jgi:hypothetical protein
VTFARTSHRWSSRRSLLLRAGDRETRPPSLRLSDRRTIRISGRFVTAQRTSLTHRASRYCSSPRRLKPMPIESGARSSCQLADLTTTSLSPSRSSTTQARWPLPLRPNVHDHLVYRMAYRVGCSRRQSSRPDGTNLCRWFLMRGESAPNRFVQSTVRGDDRSGLDVAPPREVRHATAGLLDDHRRGRRVP